MSDSENLTTMQTPSPYDPKYDPEKNPPPQIETLCEIPSLSGTLVITDPDTVTQHWKSHSNCGGQWTVDISGENAYYLAERMTAYRHTIEELVDGTIRVHVPSNEIAYMLAEEAKKFAEREGWTPEIERRPKEATLSKLQDISREHHVGVLEVSKSMRMVGVKVHKGATSKVKFILDYEGKVREIRILFD